MPLVSMAVVPSASGKLQLDSSAIPRSPYRYSRTIRLLSTLVILLVHALAITWMVALASVLLYVGGSMRVRTDANQLGPSVVQLLQPTRIVLYASIVCHALAVPNILRIQFNCASRRIFSGVKLVEAGRAASCARILFSHTPEATQLRLLIEVSLQIFQAQKMSSRAATLWLNRLLACMIVLNSWFTPLIYLGMRNCSLSSRRVVRLAGDLLLDVIYSIVFPSVILYPYVRDFIPELELSQVFVTSWLDLASKAAPGFFLAYRLPSLHSFIQQRVAGGTALAETTHRASWLSRVLHVALLACGVLVLVLHGHASWLASSTNAQGCLVEMRPWLKKMYACTVVEISCSQRAILGLEHEISAAFAAFDVSQIHALILSHCPVPPAIRSLSDLTVLKLYNSSLDNWPASAALTALTSSTFRYLFVLRTNMSAIPDGLLDPDFPSTLHDVKFVETNLTTLPTNLHERWTGVLYLVLEGSPYLSEVPETIGRFRSIVFLSLSHNSIERIPDLQLQDEPLIALYLNSNPLQALPVSVARKDTIAQIRIDHTNVSSLPDAWLAGQGPKFMVWGLYAYDTPLCDSRRNQEPYLIGQFRISCEDTTIYGKYSYPLASEEIWREANRYRH